MGVYDEIKRMQQMGLSQQDIVGSLQQKGFSQQQIETALSQEQIRQAVISPPIDQSQNQEEQLYSQNISSAPQPLTMQQSMMPPMPEEQMENTPSPYASPPEQYAPQDAYAPQESYAPQDQSQYPQENYPVQDYSQQYPEPQQSSDLIAEITEQIVSEKLASIKTQLEKTIDLKTITETKISHLDERMQRIEKIIDRLQLSILQKVGEYTTNVSDIKKELLETQKSFKTINSTPQTQHKPHEHPESHEHHKHKIKK